MGKSEPECRITYHVYTGGSLELGEEQQAATIANDGGSNTA